MPAIQPEGSVSTMPTVLWIVFLILVAALAFLGGMAFGRGFWRDVTWIGTRR